MTRHTIFNFQLHRVGVILVVIGCVLLSVLFAAAGYFAGYAHAGRMASREVSSANASSSTGTVATSTASPPAAASPTAAMPAAGGAAPAEEYVLRAEQTSSEAEAKAVQARLKVKEIESVIVPVPLEGGLAVYSVELVTRYTTRQAAAEAAARLDDHDGIAVVVVPAAPLAKGAGS